jgi:hypothetical protein
MLGGQIRDRRHAAGLTLAALALFVRLLFPTGFMLSPDRASLPTIVICTGQGAMTVTLDASGHKVEAGQGGGDHRSDGKTSHPCTFAAATVSAVAPVLVAVLIPQRLAQMAIAPLLTTQRPGLGLAAPPPPTTGPPARI